MNEMQTQEGSLERESRGKAIETLKEGSYLQAQQARGTIGWGHLKAVRLLAYIHWGATGIVWGQEGALRSAIVRC